MRAAALAVAAFFAAFHDCCLAAYNGPSGPFRNGTTTSIGGSALVAGSCSTATVAISGAAVGMAVVATPSTYPGVAIYWHGYVSAANTVAVSVCAAVAATPAAAAYNVRVLP